MRKIAGFKKRITACFMAFVMVAGGVCVPQKSVSAEPVRSSTSEEVTAQVEKLKGNSDWSEYNYSVTNGTDSAISGIKIKVPFTGTVDNLKSWGCSASKSGSDIIISYTAVLNAGQTYSCIRSDDIKFGFGGGATLGSPTVEFVYGTEGGGETSSGELKYELTGKTKTVAATDTPVGKHGKLRLADVTGYDAPIIVDKNGTPFQLRGASSHGIQWDVGYNYVNKGAYQSLRDEWGVNMVRLAAYVTQNGYTAGAKDSMDTVIQRGVQAATDLGMYVIVDWHIHAENPHTTKADAKAFFTKYATMYKDYNNVIFEICNEPTGVEWYNGNGSDLYTYCKEIAKVIRDCGSDALIVCGTNTWSQDVDDVVKKPLKSDGFENILYTFHFYSGSHYEDKMKKVETAIKAQTPIFVTEFGVCDASGNGSFDTANADKWINLFDENGVSYCCWSLCNKDESASYLKSSCSKKEGGWVEADLATTAIWLVNTYRAHQDAENGTSTTVGDFTLSVSPENGVIPNVEEMYEDPGKLTITIENTGNKTLEGLVVSFGKGSNTDFEVVKTLSSTTLASGKSDTVEISLKAGKSAKKYTDSVIVKSGSLIKSCNISQTVAAKTVQLEICEIDVSKLPGGSNYTDNTYLNSLDLTLNNGELTLKTGHDYKIVGVNSEIEISLKKDANSNSEKITMEAATIKGLDAEVAVEIKGSTTVTGNINASYLLLDANTGEVKVGGYLDAGNVDITSGNVTVDTGIKSSGTVRVSGGTVTTKGGSNNNAAIEAKNVELRGGEVTAYGGTGASVVSATEAVTIKSNAKISVCSTTGEAGEVKDAISSKSITVETGATITPDETSKTALFSITPKNESGLDVDVLKYTGETSSTTEPGQEQPGQEQHGGGGTQGNETPASGGNTQPGGNNQQIAPSDTATQDDSAQDGSAENKTAAKIKIKASKKTVKVGKTIKLKATLSTNKKFKKFSWKSSNKKIAKVSKKGVVKGIKKGKTKITVTALDGSGTKATIKIKVK
ncbi:MAG: cellulase family glycosylhydrolase [Lachnospiraceae bacterium]|nr:cellulase family glycosylhydrolase [Lachnospiraceae bacterium]